MWSPCAIGSVEKPLFAESVDLVSEALIWRDHLSNISSECRIVAGKSASIPCIRDKQEYSR
jgi:hypothetical protein